MAGEVYSEYIKAENVAVSQKQDNETLELSAYISTDGGEWRKVYELCSEKGNGEEIAVAPVIPLRSRKIKIKICGEVSGDAYATLYGIYLDSEKGSEISG